MEFIQKITVSKSTARYESEFSSTEKMAVLAAAIAPIIAIIVLLLLLFLKFGTASVPIIALCCVLCGMFLSVSIICLVYLLMRKNFITDIFIDDDNIYIRGRKGYYKFNRFEVGTVMIPPGICQTDAVTGIGDKNFSVTKKTLVFSIGNVHNKIRAKNADKLAYVLYNIAQNSASCVNWGLAFESRTE